ncbi:MAG: septation protein SpoVG family protein [Planctomycetes bacterium]|nr:septation protein SpoVG family protein [Planctomycetota bacterium]
MEITDVQVKPIIDSRSKLKAFCTITFDGCFVIKDVRIIEGTKGLLVAMPVKKFTFKCFKCGAQNPLSAKFCNDCGRRIRASNVKRNSHTGKPLFQVDVAHPITPDLRQKLEETVISKYKEALADPNLVQQHTDMDVVEEVTGNEAQPETLPETQPEIQPDPPQGNL